MALTDVFKDKEVQGALLVGLIDNLEVYMVEKGIVLTGGRKAILDLTRIAETGIGYLQQSNPLFKGIFVASIPLTMHTARYFVEGLIKGYSRSSGVVRYSPPPATPITGYTTSSSVITY